MCVCVCVCECVCACARVSLLQYHCARGLPCCMHQGEQCRLWSTKSLLGICLTPKATIATMPRETNFDGTVSPATRAAGSHRKWHRPTRSSQRLPYFPSAAKVSQRNRGQISDFGRVLSSKQRTTPLFSFGSLEPPQKMPSTKGLRNSAGAYAEHSVPFVQSWELRVFALSQSRPNMYLFYVYMFSKSGTLPVVGALLNNSLNTSTIGPLI